MIQDVLGWVDYSICAEIALCLFFGVFVAVAIRMFFFKTDWIKDAARIPLDDGETDKS